MGDALTAVWQRLDSSRPVFMQDDVISMLNGARDCVGGLLLQAESLPNTRTGENELRLPCPACGPIPIHPDCLRRWSIDVGRLLGLVAAAAGMRSALVELVEGHLWYVGAATWLGRSHQVYFARFVHGHSRAGVLAGLAPRPRSVLLHPTEHAVSIWGVTTPNPAVALESVVKLGPDGFAFDAGVMESCLADAGFGVTKSKLPRKRSEPKPAEVSADTRSCRSIDCYAEGQVRIIDIDGVRVTLQFVGRKGRRARIAITAPSGTVFARRRESSRRRRTDSRISITSASRQVLRC
jgi:hypothetical protein